MNKANKNFYTNILHLLANIVVGLLYTPYLVKCLGMTAYGVVPLALVINQYINVLSISLINAVSRFYSIEYRTQNYIRASKYFSTAIISSILFFLFLFPLLFICTKFVNHVFDIPNYLLVDSISLFNYTIFSFFVSIISDCVSTIFFADNRIDLVNYLKIIRQISKLVINISCFVAFNASIVYVGISNIISEILVLILSIIFYKKIKPQNITFKLVYFEKTFLFSMISMISWVIIQRFADTFLYKIDTIFTNFFWGVKMTGVIGSISEFCNYVISITGIITSLISPLMLILYSKKEYRDYISFTINGSYISALLSSLLCGLIAGFSSPILLLWIGTNFTQYNIFLIIKIIVIPFTTAGAIFSNVYLYGNHIKYPALVSVLIAIANIIINFILIRITNSVIIFLIFDSIFILCQGLIMNVFFFNKTYKGYLGKITKLTIKYLMFMIVFFIICFISEYYIKITNITELMIILFTYGVIGLIIMDIFFIRGEQLNMLYNLIPAYKRVREFIVDRLRIK